MDQPIGRSSSPLFNNLDSTSDLHSFGNKTSIERQMPEHMLYEYSPPYVLYCTVRHLDARPATRSLAQATLVKDEA